jgi:hypothetical protein
MISRCALCRLCLTALENPTDENLEAARIGFLDSSWYSPILTDKLSWRQEEHTRSYFTHPNSFAKNHAKQFAGVLLFEKMPTSWELAKRNCSLDFFPESMVF